jgi:hypothetical protein
MLIGNFEKSASLHVVPNVKMGDQLHTFPECDFGLLIARGDSRLGDGSCAARHTSRRLQGYECRQSVESFAAGWNEGALND